MRSFISGMPIQVSEMVGYEIVEKKVKYHIPIRVKKGIKRWPIKPRVHTIQKKYGRLFVMDGVIIMHPDIYNKLDKQGKIQKY